jgi:hypothetical protein
LIVGLHLQSLSLLLVHSHVGVAIEARREITCWGAPSCQVECGSETRGIGGTESSLAEGSRAHGIWIGLKGPKLGGGSTWRIEIGHSTRVIRVPQGSETRISVWSIGIDTIESHIISSSVKGGIRSPLIIIVVLHPVVCSIGPVTTADVESCILWPPLIVLAIVYPPSISCSILLWVILVVALIIPLIIVVLIPLEAIPSVILLPLILCLLLLSSLPCSLRPVHIVGGLIVVETEILWRRHTHSILVVIVLPCVIGNSPRVILVSICLPGVSRGPYRIVWGEVQRRLSQTPASRVIGPLPLLRPPLIVVIVLVPIIPLSILAMIH